MKLILSDQPLSVALPEHSDTRLIDLSRMKIANCVGCFGCWTKTPGKCVIRDDAVQVYPLIAQSEAVLYVSRIKYGGYDTTMKTMLERAIPIQQAFLRLVEGEIHHVQRRVVEKRAVIVGYGATGPEEEALFRQLVARNARNMNFKSWDVVFCAEESRADTVRKELETWTKS